MAEARIIWRCDCGETVYIGTEESFKHAWGSCGRCGARYGEEPLASRAVDDDQREG